MNNVSSDIARKIKLRKVLMIVFSLSFIILICGILNTIFEDGNESVNSVRLVQAENDTAVLDTAVLHKENPRELHRNKTDKKIRLFGAFVLCVLIFSSFAADLIFVRCPCCSKHISYSVTPSQCDKCGTSFKFEEQKR